MDQAAPADELAALLALARQVQAVLTERGLTLATAELCTGGLIGHVLTEIPGSSDYYVGGVISYSDQLKRSELGVNLRTLERHGAVSAQTCVAMAEGARHRYGSSLAVAVTGVAGPGGGSAAKPIGLTYVAIADEDGHDVRRAIWHDERHANKLHSAEAALTLILARVGVDVAATA